MSNIKYSREKNPLTVEITGRPGAGKSSVARLIAAALQSSGMDVMLASRDDLINYSTAQANMENVPVVVTDSLYDGPLFDEGHWNWQHDGDTVISGEPSDHPIRDRGDFWSKIESSIRAIGLLSTSSTDDALENLVDNNLASLVTPTFTQYKHPRLNIERKGGRVSKIEITVFGLFSAEPFERTYILYGPENIVCMMRNERDQEAYQETPASNDMARHQVGLVEVPKVREDIREGVLEDVKAYMADLRESYPIDPRETAVEVALDRAAISDTLAKLIKNRFGREGLIKIDVVVRTTQIQVDVYFAEERQVLTFERPPAAPYSTLVRLAKLTKQVWHNLVKVAMEAQVGNGARPGQWFNNDIYTVTEQGLAVSVSAVVRDQNDVPARVLLSFDPTIHQLDNVRGLFEEVNMPQPDGVVLVGQGVKVDFLSGPSHVLINKLTTNIAGYVAAIRQDSANFDADSFASIIEACQADLQQRLLSFEIPEPVVSVKAEEGILTASVTIGASQAVLSASYQQIPAGPAKRAVANFHNDVKSAMDTINSHIGSGDIGNPSDAFKMWDSITAGTLAAEATVYIKEDMMAAFHTSKDGTVVASFRRLHLPEKYDPQMGLFRHDPKKPKAKESVSTVKVDVDVGDNYPRDKKLTAAALRKSCRIPRGVGSLITPAPSEWPKTRVFLVAAEGGKTYRVRLRATNEKTATTEAKPNKLAKLGKPVAAKKAAKKK